uniref:Uncharacterized protein n=1 Tax=Anguilla anguilla TaxID=7936 RepID=A0A0E9VV23_ANGAN
MAFQRLKHEQTKNVGADRW